MQNTILGFIGSLFLASLLMTSAPDLSAATLKACKAEKRQATKLERAFRRGKLAKGYKTRDSMRDALRDAEDFIWKECKEHARALGKWGRKKSE